MKHNKEVAGFLANGDYEVTEEGLLIHRAIMAKGLYTHSVNGEDLRKDSNLIPAEGIAYILDAALGAGSQITSWYLAVFSGNVEPATNWTAANFTANASEIVSNTEGYSNATRPAWTPGAVSSGVIGNISSKATFDIICTSAITISGAAMLSNNIKGGTNGTLVSATRFASERVVNNGDAFELGYEVELTDS